MLQQRQDFLQAFLFDHAEIRGKIVRLSDSIHSITEGHGYPPAIHALLGELLVAVVLLSSTLQYKGQLTLQFQSEGALKMLVAKCNHRLEIRGVAQWDSDADTQQLKTNFFSGQLVMTLDDARNHQRQQSIVAIDNKTIAQAIEVYFNQSEQIATKIILGNNGRHFAGFLIQKMPSCSPHAVNVWQHIAILAHTLQQDELLQWNNQKLLTCLFHEEQLRLFNAVPVIFKCSCNIQKAQDSLRLLGQNEALASFVTQKKLVVACEYCNTSHVFDKQAVQQLFH